MLGRLLLLALLPFTFACPQEDVPTANPQDYVRVNVANDPGLTGVFDPSLVIADGASDGVMAYSTVDFTLDADQNLLNRVSTSVAVTANGGGIWTHETYVQQWMDATITVGNNDVCGTPACDGMLISEVPTLIYDVQDPDTTQRYKLLSHRYFHYPPGPETLYRALGGIAYYTAPSPSGPWASEGYLFGWDLSPPEVTYSININQLGGDAASCLAVSEPSMEVFGDDIDLVFACPYADGSEVPIRIILLRSSDHGQSFELVSTLLEAGDAKKFGGDHYSAPELVNLDGRAVLMVTPSKADGTYQGCVVYELNGVRSAVNPATYFLPTLAGRFGGACSYAPGAESIYMSQLFVEGNPTDPFRMFATGVTP